MALDIETRLRGTRRGHVIQEFFTHSGHFPLAILLFEFLMEGPRNFPTRPDIYVLLAAGVVQAVRVAGELSRATDAELNAHGLGAGIGVNTGPLVEGLLGMRASGATM